MNPTKIKVYVAGPYTKGDTIINVRAALEVAEQLMTHGFIPFIPHLYHFWHYVFPHTYAYWMDLDDQWLRSCNALLRIPGESSGADIEVVVARSLDIPVFFSLEELLASVKTIQVITPSPTGKAEVL